MFDQKVTDWRKIIAHFDWLMSDEVIEVCPQLFLDQASASNVPPLFWRAAINQGMSLRETLERFFRRPFPNDFEVVNVFLYSFGFSVIKTIRKDLETLNNWLDQLELIRPMVEELRQEVSRLGMSESELHAFLLEKLPERKEGEIKELEELLATDLQATSRWTRVMIRLAETELRFAGGFFYQTLSCLEKVVTQPPFWQLRRWLEWARHRLSGAWPQVGYLPKIGAFVEDFFADRQNRANIFFLAQSRGV